MGTIKQDFWKRVAFVTRYGHQALPDIMLMPSSDLRDYTDALAELIGEENRVPGHND